MGNVIGWPFQNLIRDVYLPYFNAKGEAAIRFLVLGKVSRMAFLSAYKTIPQIEEMPEKEKKEMKKYVLEMFPDKTPEEKIEICKIVYTIGTLI